MSRIGRQHFWASVRGASAFIWSKHVPYVPRAVLPVLCLVELVPLALGTRASCKRHIAVP